MGFPAAGIVRFAGGVGLLGRCGFGYGGGDRFGGGGLTFGLEAFEDFLNY